MKNARNSFNKLVKRVTQQNISSYGFTEFSNKSIFYHHFYASLFGISKIKLFFFSFTYMLNFIIFSLATEHIFVDLDKKEILQIWKKLIFKHSIFVRIPI